MIHVLILAPTPALRSGLRALLSGEENIEVLAEAASISELHELDGLDVLLMADEDIMFEALRDVLEKAEPPPAILLLNEQPEAARAIAGLPLRAWGLLSPDVGEQELIAAVMALHEGLLTASPALMQPLLGPASVMDQAKELIEE